jgi:hypothetical protein
MREHAHLNRVRREQESFLDEFTIPAPELLDLARFRALTASLEALRPATSPEVARRTDELIEELKACARRSPLVRDDLHTLLLTRALKATTRAQATALADVMASLRTPLALVRVDRGAGGVFALLELAPGLLLAPLATVGFLDASDFVTVTGLGDADLEALLVLGRDRPLPEALLVLRALED